MLFDGKAIGLKSQNDILHMIFDIKDQKVNVMGDLFMSDLKEVLKVIQDKQKSHKGLLVRSNKDSFIFGADVTEFMNHFKKSETEMEKWIMGTNEMMNGFEDLSIPSVTCINGFALGGGFEMCLTTDYRIASEDARVGLPETKLGIMPGWGGSVRLSRLSGADNAIEWITSGKQYRAADALKIKAVDAVVSLENLEKAGLATLDKMISGELNWKKKKAEKLNPLTLNQIEGAMTFEVSKGFVAGVAGPNYPAPVKAIDVIQKGAHLGRDEALKIEAKAFAYLAHTKVAENLVTVFLGDQYLKKTSKKVSKSSEPIKMAAVLGAGIMGGGVAYQSASKGTPILMKDINSKALHLGMNEATGLLGKQIKRKKIDATKMAQTISMITPTLSYGDFKNVDIVVEAVVENKKIKASVLAELEDNVREDTIIASNTSTIDISDLAEGLKRPENFCGMHFFNPVHRMPLVEVIRGKKTSDAAIAKTVKYALQMGKTPIVVNDCPGFLVNRVLFPYFNGFNHLIADGVDYKRIDKVMEKFGWPMGPAYLMDVVGIDTGDHAASIMANAFERMNIKETTIVEALHKSDRLGQKNKVGFYKYELDRKGKLQKVLDPSVDSIIASVVKKKIEVTDEEIIERMMLPMIFESARCLDEKIVQTPIEVDMGLLLGLGFPPFRTGAMKYADSVGLSNLIEASKKYGSFGEMYSAPKGFIEKAKNNETYYQG